MGFSHARWWYNVWWTDRRTFSRRWRRRAVVHHRNSVLSLLSCRRLARIHSPTTLTEAVIFCRNKSVADGWQAPNIWVSSVIALRWGDKPRFSGITAIHRHLYLYLLIQQKQQLEMLDPVSPIYCDNVDMLAHHYRPNLTHAALGGSREPRMPVNSSQSQLQLRELIAVIDSFGLHFSKVYSRCNTDRQRLKRVRNRRRLTMWITPSPNRQSMHSGL